MRLSIAIVLLLMTQAIGEERRELIKSIASAHQLNLQSGETLKLYPEALMVWSNPVRGDTTGGIFLWTQGSRPAAVGGVYLWHENDRHLLAREFHSLTDKPLTASRGGQELWSPVHSDLAWTGIKPKFPRAGSPVQRLRQFKQISSEFEIEVSQANRGRYKLRPLTTPIYRYQDDQSGIIDGAIIAWCQGTDPEAFLLIEAFENDSSAIEWRYAIARSTSWRVLAKRGDTVVYDRPFYRFRATPPTAPFYNIPKRPLTE